MKDDQDQADEQLLDELRAAFEPVRFTVPLDSLRLLERSGNRQVDTDVPASGTGSGRRLPRRGFIAVAAAGVASVAVAGGVTLSLRRSQPVPGAPTGLAPAGPGGLRKIAAIPIDTSARFLSMLVLSPDGHLLAFSANHQIQLWNVADPAHPVHSAIPGVNAAIAGFSPNGRTLVVTTSVPAFQLWNVANPSNPTKLGEAALANPLRDIALSADGRTLVASSDSSNTTAIQIWDLSKPDRPRMTGTLLMPHSLFGSLTLSRDGKTLGVVQGQPGNTVVTLWDISNPAHPVAGPAIQAPPSLSGFILLDLINPPLAILSNGNGIELWSLSDPAHPARLTTLPEAGSKALLVSMLDPNGTTLAVVRGNSPKGGGLVTYDQATIWDITDPRRPVKEGDVPITPPGAGYVAINPGVRTVAVTTADHIELWGY